MGRLGYNIIIIFRNMLAYINKVLTYWHTFPCTVCVEYFKCSVWKTSINGIACSCLFFTFCLLGFIVRDCLCNVYDRNMINKQNIKISWWDISAYWICVIHDINVSVNSYFLEANYRIEWSRRKIGSESQMLEFVISKVHCRLKKLIN